MSTNVPRKYHAFISYRHADNKQQGRQWATWLHQSLEAYEVPEELVGKVNDRGETIPARIYPIFRDEEELPAHADLATTLKSALADSSLLLVLCSPRSAASTYVCEEIEHYKKLGNSGRIIAALIDGEPNTSWDTSKHKDGFTAEDECFPEPLQFEYNQQGERTSNRAEPIAADFRVLRQGVTEQGWTTPEAYRHHLKQVTTLNSKDIDELVKNYQARQQKAFLKIVSGILGVPLGELTQRDKAHLLRQQKLKAKKLQRWLSAVAMLAVIAFAASIVAYQQTIEAQKQYQLTLAAQQQAELERDSALTTQSLFLSDLAQQEKAKGHHNRALLLALNAVPGPHGGQQRPEVESAQQGLKALAHNFRTEDIWENKSYLGQFADGQKVLLQDYGKSLYLWDRQSNQVTLWAENIADTINKAMFFEQLGIVVIQTDSRKLLSFELSTGEQVAEFESSSIYNPIEVDYSVYDNSILVEERGEIYLISAINLEVLFHLNVPFSENQTLWQLFLNSAGDKALLSLRPGNGPAQSTIAVIDLVDNKPLFWQSFETETYGFMASGFVGSDDFWIAPADKHGLIQHFSLQNGEYQLKQELSFDDAIDAIVYDPIADIVAVAEGHNLHIYLSNNRVIRLPHDEEFLHNEYTYVRFTPDGRNVAVSLEGNLYAWDLKTLKRLFKQPIMHLDNPLLPQANFDFIRGTQLLAGTVTDPLSRRYYTNELRTWNLQPDTDAVYTTDSQNVDYFALTPDEELIVISNFDKEHGGSTGYITKLKPENEQYQQFETLKKSERGLTAPSTLIQDKHLLFTYQMAFTGIYEVISKLDIKGVPEEKIFPQNTKSNIIADGNKRRFPTINKLISSNDGSQFFSVSNSGEVASRMVEDGSVNWLFNQSGLDAKLAKNNNVSLLATGGREELVFILNASNGEVINQFEQTGAVTALTFHPTKNIVASADDNGQITLFDIDNNRRLFETEFDEVARFLAFNDSGTVLASCTADRSAGNKLRLFDAEKGQLISERALPDECTSLQFRPGSNHFVTSVKNHTLTIWSTEFDSAMAVLDNDVQRCNVRFSHNGQRLFSSCNREAIKVFDLPRLLSRYQHIESLLPEGQRCLSDSMRERFFLPKRSDAEKAQLQCL